MGKQYKGSYAKRKSRKGKKKSFVRTSNKTRCKNILDDETIEYIREINDSIK
jgi:hypothetical protein